MIKLAILTCSEIDPKSCNDDNLLIPLLREQGVEAVFEIWDDPNVLWSNYDCVLVRSTWDYTHKLEKFIIFIETLPEKVKLFNAKEIILSNYNKSYLLELERKGFEIVPTSKGVVNKENIASLFEQYKTTKLVIKPLVGASADGIQVIEKQSSFQLKEISLPQLIQPFQESISTEGEISLVYFNGVFSHAISKVPKENEYRSQEEFGSTISSFSPDTETTQYAKDVLTAISCDTLFARIDLLKNKEGNWRYIGEVELIEPALYLSYDSSAKKNFVDAICERIKDE